MSGLVIAVALLALSGFPGLLISRRSSIGQTISVLLAVAGSSLGLFATIRWALGHEVATLDLPWTIPGGWFQVDIDGLSALFLVPIFLVSMLGSIYGLGYWPQAEHPAQRPQAVLFLRTAAGRHGAAGDRPQRAGRSCSAGNSWPWRPSSWSRPTTKTPRPARPVGSTWWPRTSARCLLFALFALFWVQTKSFEFVALPATANEAWLTTAIFLIALVAFGIKAGIMPLHVWLPGAHANAPSHVSALMSGVIIKMGIYGLVRTVSLLPVPPTWWGVLLLVLGGISGVLGWPLPSASTTSSGCWPTAASRTSASSASAWAWR